MKKSLVAAMFAVMMISLVGCGKVSEPKTIETTEVVEEVTEEATEIVEETTETEEATEVPEPTEAPAAEEPVAEEPASPYSYTELSQTMYAQSTVNVRDLPEQTGAKLGSLSTNQEVTVTGQCNETGWYRISYNGGEGFVSNSYLGSEKVAVKSSQSKSSSATQAPAEAAAEAPAQEAAEAPAQEAPADPYAGKTWQEKVEYNSTMGLPTMTGLTEAEQAAYIDSCTLKSDSYGCPWCGYTTTSYDEYHNHLIEEGVAGLQ